MTENPIRKDPLRELRDAVDRVLQEGAAAVQGIESLAVDMYETDTTVVVVTTVVGATPDTIDVSMTDDKLTISGETQPGVEVDESAYLRRERRFGKFARTVQVPRPVVAEEASASYKHGVLTITIPKVPEAQSKKVEITEG
jgi:HSP20 family protein